jgi:hypothetical protein
MGVCNSVNSHRILQATSLWHPNFTSIVRFVKSTFLLMKNYNSRIVFANKMPKIHESLLYVEECL